MTNPRVSDETSWFWSGDDESGDDYDHNFGVRIIDSVSDVEEPTADGQSTVTPITTRVNPSFQSFLATDGTLWLRRRVQRSIHGTAIMDAQTNAPEASLAPMQAQGNQNGSSKVYDIETLIELGKTTKITRKQLRFSEEAPAEHILKAQKNEMGHGGHSDMPNVPHITIDEDDEIMYRGSSFKNLPQPIRQPYGPPQSSLMQEDEGFARFLKNHASPPHNRVTAGGRVVPAGPLSPPPMFRMDFIDRFLEEHEAAKRMETKLEYNQRSVSTSDESLAAGVKQTRSAGNTNLGDAVIDPHTTHTETPEVQTQNEPTTGNTFKASDAPPTSAQSTATPVLQLPLGAEPIMMLGDGSAIVSFNGTMLRAMLRGVDTLLEPLQMVQPFALTPMAPVQQLSQAPQVFPTQHTVPLQTMVPTQPLSVQLPPEAKIHPAGLPPVNQSLPLIPHQQPEPALHLTKASNNIHHPYTALQTQIRALTIQHNACNSELTALDKYVALHHQEISPTQMALIATQRKHLVEKLDQVRISRKQLDQTAPVPTQGIYRPNINAGPNGNLLNIDTSMMNFNAQRFNEVASDRPTWLSNKAMGSASTLKPTELSPNGPKTLSPNAPSFVPGSTTPSAAFGHDQYHLGKAPNFAEQGRSNSVSAATETRLGSSERELNTDPVVHPDEAEYCNEMGYNNPEMPKMYCSEVSEYQEVIRAVREQAKRYGCKGGQSKDPEYDAEQDVRWAMQDKVPIPLPPMCPDYMTNPRSWDWQDSVFNVRVGHDWTWNPPRYFKKPGVVQREPHFDIWSAERLAEAKATEIPKPHKRKDSWDTDYSDSDRPIVENDAWKGKFHGPDNSHPGNTWNRVSTIYGDTQANASATLANRDQPYHFHYEGFHKRKDSWDTTYSDSVDANIKAEALTYDAAIPGGSRFGNALERFTQPNVSALTNEHDHSRGFRPMGLQGRDDWDMGNKNAHQFGRHRMEQGSWAPHTTVAGRPTAVHIPTSWPPSSAYGITQGFRTHQNGHITMEQGSGPPGNSVSAIAPVDGGGVPWAQSIIYGAHSAGFADSKPGNYQLWHPRNYSGKRGDSRISNSNDVDRRNLQQHHWSHDTSASTGPLMHSTQVPIHEHYTGEDVNAMFPIRNKQGQHSQPSRNLPTGKSIGTRKATVEDAINDDSFHGIQACSQDEEGFVETSKSSPQAESIGRKDGRNSMRHNGLNDWRAMRSDGDNVSKTSQVPETRVKGDRSASKSTRRSANWASNDARANLLNDKSINPEEVKAIAIDGPRNDGKSKGFLRGMLKKPKVFWTQQPGEPTPAFLKRYEAQDKAATEELDDIRKWKAKSVANENRPLGNFEPIAAGQDPLAHKAPSSLASPTFHARGFLPQTAGTPTKWPSFGPNANTQQLQPSLAAGGGAVDLSSPGMPRNLNYGLGGGSVHGFDRTIGLHPYSLYRTGDRSYASLRAQERAEASNLPHVQSTDW